MFEDALWGLGPLGLILVGALILWGVSWLRYRGVPTSSVVNSIAPTVAGWTILLLGVGVTSFAMTFGLAPLIWVTIAVVVAGGFARYWHSEVRFLIWMLSEAALRGIALESAARAFANERYGTIAVRARNLADYLDAAMPLSLAMARSGLRIPPEIRLAADIGEKTGTLGKSLRKAVNQINESERVTGTILVKFLYLGALIAFMGFVVTFLMIKIIPTFIAMFEEFDILLPKVTLTLIEVSRAFVNYWFLVVPVLMFVGLVAFLGLLQYLGISLRNLPVLGRFFAPIDSVSVMQTLSVAVREQRPIAEVLELLATHAALSRSQRRLRRAVERVNDGVHWCDALQQTGFITAEQSAVFKSAERAGNLAWSLSEMADSVLRRSAQRAQAALGVLFPMMILSFGVVVLLVVVGMMSPLFSLISSLA